MTIDKYGSLGQIQQDGSIDGGDSVNWEGHKKYLCDVEGRYLYETIAGDVFVNYEDFFRGSRLGYVRHPHNEGTTNSYYKNPWNGNISRDQLQGILAYYIKHQDYKELFKIFLHHGAWLWLFAYNTVRNGDTSFKWKWPDVTGPDVWAMYIRGFRPYGYLLYPLLCLLDIHMLLSTLHFNYTNQDDDQISFAIKSITQKEYVPTPISLLAWKILDKTKLIKLVQQYWCGWRRNCDMAELYEMKLREIR